MTRGRFVFAYLACLTCSFAADWPQWRGPGRDGISAERININWPASGPKVLWRGAVGTGFSAVSISQGRAYTLGNTTNQDTVWCFDALSGRTLWRHDYSSQLGPQYYEGGPGSTPTIADGRVFTLSKWGDVFCFDAGTGAVIWQRDLRADGLKPNRWGFAGSPLLWRDLVVLNAGAAGVALDWRTGRVAWANGTNGAGYASPTLFGTGSNEAVLIFAAKHLIAVEVRTGRELWRHFWETGWDTNNTDPLVEGERVFISSFTRGCALLSISNNVPEVLYDNKVLFNHLSPGVVVGDCLYAFNGEAKQETDFRCLDLANGTVKWTRKDPAFGTMIAARGRLIVLSDKGELLASDASPAEFKPLARAKVLSGVCWTPPSLAGGLLYVRNARGELVCLDLR